MSIEAQIIYWILGGLAFHTILGFILSMIPLEGDTRENINDGQGKPKS